MNQAKVLLLERSEANGLGETLRGILHSATGFDIKSETSGMEIDGSGGCDEQISGIMFQYSPDVVLAVLPPSFRTQADGLFQSIRRQQSQVPIIAVAEAGEPGELFELLKLGASDFITPPLKSVDVLPRLWRLLEHTRQRETLQHRLKERLGLKQLIGSSPAFVSEIRKIPLLARCDAGVLISGETGTGKELCARAIHYLGPRASRPFVPVNCGAIPVELVENELFGHERGAFTGASNSQAGLICEADGGTLFLDEIDCLPLPSQVKLLRFLQDKEYRPLGSPKVCKADVRIIAATNIDFEEAVRAGKVRQDLYYRLNVIPLMLPPLRERREDIPLLALHFLEKYASEFDRPATNFSWDATQKLILYDWPGNVRELEHVVERAIVLSEQVIIQETSIILPCSEKPTSLESFQKGKAKVVAQFERAYIEQLLMLYQGNITKAAQAARKNRRAFWQLMHKHRIDAQSYKSAR